MISPLVLSIVATALIFVIVLLIRSRSLDNKLKNISAQLSNTQTQLKEAHRLRGELENLMNERKKFEEKAKKLWQIKESLSKKDINSSSADPGNELLKAEREKMEEEKRKLDDKIKKLWQQSVAIHKEKERINTLKTEIEQRHQEMLDSVTYAKRIQEAILPHQDEITSHLSQSFILFKPRDIVSGDFYWFFHQNKQSFIASVDCTGHGVPGAFMSLIGNTMLNEIVKEKKISDPGLILTELNKEINIALKQTNTSQTFGVESRDGMDIALLRFDFAKNELCFAGAKRPLYIIRAASKDQLEELKSDRFPIGGANFDGGEKNFKTHTLTINKEDVFYAASDGFADQFNNQGKKLMTKKFKEILLTLQEKSMAEQKSYLGNFMEKWKEQMEQTDDILVIGVKVP